MLFHKRENSVIVAGHRGICAEYPENTMLSYRKAIELGVDQLEIDLNLTKDGHVVLIHDCTVDRTTEKAGRVRDYTLEEIRQMDAGSFKDYAFRGEKIPPFEELLAYISDTDVSLNVEIKDRTFETVRKAVDMLRAYHMEDRFVIACWDANILQYAHEKFGVMTQGFPDNMLVNFSNETRSHLYSVGIPVSMITKELCDEYINCGIQPWSWCPDTEESAEKAIACGARLLTCNDPAPAMRVAKRLGLGNRDGI